MRAEYFVLEARLKEAIDELLMVHDQSVVWLPEVRQRLCPSLGSGPYFDRSHIDETRRRRSSDIRAIGEELFGLGGIGLMRMAISDYEPRASRVVEVIWDGIGGCWAA